jgi:CelD/BcsL family acetyltransferase involved in cellulose biosynthesis
MPPAIGQVAARTAIPGEDLHLTAPPATPRRQAHWPERRFAGGSLRIVVAETAEELARHAVHWQDLADHALEANAFYEPWLLMPAVRRLREGERLLFAMVYDDDGAAPRMCGFFPLERRSRFHGVPVPMLRLWKHLHCFLCVPLLRADRAREALDALLEWAAQDAGAQVVDFSYVSGDGLLQQILVERASVPGTLTCAVAGFTRALWRRREADAEAYLRALLSGGVRKEYRRQRRRLEETGRLDFDEPAPGAEALEAFLELEAGGWKGREGTALKQDERQRAFVLEAARQGPERVRLFALLFDGRPIAMLLCFRSGQGLFAFKIAYDEAFAKFSPGVQLTLEVLGVLHADESVAWMDSCAMPDHPMINRLLCDRRIVQSLLVSTGGWRGDLLVSAYPLARWAARTARTRSLRMKAAQ